MLADILPILIIIFVIWWLVTPPKVWRETPTLQEYLKQYPNCHTDRGIKCAACNSTSIKNWGLRGAADSRRFFICNHCNSRLYRSNDW